MIHPQHDDQCPGCLPVMFNLKTSTPYPDDSPQVKAMMTVWATTTYEERQAFHQFTCLNSRDPADIAVIEHIAKRIEEAGL